MKVLFDINHPAHIHFFKNPARLLLEQGAEVRFTSRDKDITLSLLDELGFDHLPLSISKAGSAALLKELITRDRALLQVVNQYKPDVMAAIGGTFIAHVGAITRIPSLVFYDTENATLQNLITYPFASRVITPECYSGWTPKRRHISYKGYHELSYLAPQYFKPDRDKAIANGLDTNQQNFFIRVVAWTANHDIGETGWSESLLTQVVKKLEQRGKVFISSENKLPDALSHCQYQGKVSEVHHLMAFCDLFVGESATMASESVALGVYAIYAANTPRGYTTEQEHKYKLVTNIDELVWPKLENAIEEALATPPEEIKKRHHNMLDNCIDVADMACKLIVQHALSDI